MAALITARSITAVIASLLLAGIQESCHALSIDVIPDIDAKIGDDFTLWCNVTGAPPLTMGYSLTYTKNAEEWCSIFTFSGTYLQFDGLCLSRNPPFNFRIVPTGSTNFELHLPGATQSDAGEYTCKFRPRNEAESTSDVIHVRVHEETTTDQTTTTTTTTTTKTTTATTTTTTEPTTTTASPTTVPPSTTVQTTTLAPPTTRTTVTTSTTTTTQVPSTETTPIPETTTTSQETSSVTTTRLTSTLITKITSTWSPAMVYTTTPKPATATVTSYSTVNGTHPGVVVSQGPDINLTRSSTVSADNPITTRDPHEGHNHSNSGQGTALHSIETTGAIIGGAVGGILLVAIVIIVMGVCFYRRKIRNLKRRSTTSSRRNLTENIGGYEVPLSSEEMSLNYNSLPRPEVRATENVYATIGDDEGYEVPITAIEQPTYAKMQPRSKEFSLADLKLLEELGRGHFGTVYTAVIKTQTSALPEGTQIAVKMLKDDASDTDRKNFMKEIDIMDSMPNHENVVQLYGYSSPGCSSAFLVLEYLALGNLNTYLRRSRGLDDFGNTGDATNVLNLEDLLNCALDVARGMDHVCKYGYLHRDLAARNILVSNKRVCKVSDFGLSRDVIDCRAYLSCSKGPLPLPWMAPESISESIYTSQSDVWAFGILLWEVMTLGATPYPGIASFEDLQKRIKRGYRMEKPDDCPTEMYNIMLHCWQAEPRSRPSFNQLVQTLELLSKDDKFASLNDEYVKLRTTSC